MKTCARILLALGCMVFLSDAPAGARENEESRLEWDETNEIWRFQWWGKAGRTYFLQHSENLLEPWQWIPMIESGDDSVKEWGFTTTGDKFFARLKYTDMETPDAAADDFDLDGVSNFDELQQGTDPFAAVDRDGNGMFDDWETRYFGTSGQNAADDPDGDGLTNLQESLLGTNPYATDTDGDGLRDDEDPNPFGAEINGYLGLRVAVPDRELWAEGELEMEDVDDTHIRLEWDYSGDGITHFLIERRISAGPWEEQARVSASVHEWEDEDLRANQNYYYRVRAVRAARRGDILSGASHEAAYQVPFLKAFSIRNGWLDRWKSQWSFREFETDAPAPAVPKYYLVKTDTWTYDWEVYTHDESGLTSFENSIDRIYIQTFDPSTHIYTQNGTREKSANQIFVVTGSDPYIRNWHEVENYEWFEQDRGKQNLTARAEGSYEGIFSHGDANGMIGSSYYAGYYLLDGVYVPDQGEAVWMGNDFDLSRGRINYSGLSTYEDPDDYYQGSPDIDGVWSSLPWSGSGGWEYVGGSNQSSTPTRRSLWTEYSEDSSELSQEYTTEAFMADMINDLPDWPEWNRYYYGWHLWEGYSHWYYEPYHGGWLAYRRLSASEEYFSLGRIQYRFQSNPTVSHTWTWNEIFVPDDDPETPEDESLNQQVSATHTWQAPLGGGESTDYELDPSQHTEGNGHYYLDSPLQVKGTTSSNTWMDEQEKQSSGLTFEKTGSGYEASFQLELGQASQSHTFSWQGGGITLWAYYYDENGQWIEREIHNGESLTREELQGIINRRFILRAAPAQMSVAFAGITVSAADSQGASLGDDSINAKFLPALLVDANRDGLMSFSDPQIRTADATDANSKFRFWVNDDDDRNDEDHPGSGQRDCADNQIQSLRDLEDFARLWVNVSGLHAGLVDGTFKLGLKWKSHGALKPAIKVYPAAAESDGGDAYLKDDATALSQTLGSAGTSLGTVAAGTAFIFPSSFWEGSFGGQPAVSGSHPNRYLLFEGVAEGKGELVVTLHKADGTEIGEGSSVWLDITDIKKMFQRVKATGIGESFQEPHQTTDGVPPEPTMGWIEEGQFQDVPTSWQKTEHCIVFVHGWRMNEAESLNYAETMFKRLWQRGYRGRFASMRWPTLTGLTTYNDSEYRAWKCGESLKQFVNNLPGNYTKNLVAHSMGNIVCGSALRRGMNGVANYAMLNASVPASCYDDSSDLHQPFGSNSPDHDSDSETLALAYKNKLSNVNINLINFYLASDNVLETWQENNQYFRPQFFYQITGGDHAYKYFPGNPSGEKLFLTFLLSPNRILQQMEESLSYAAKSSTLAVGAEGSAAGSISSSVNLGGAGYEDEHSAFWRFAIQKMTTRYNTLIDKLQVERIQ